MKVAELQSGKGEEISLPLFPLRLCHSAALLLLSMNYFINTLPWWQWVILAAIPPAIVALYFLKLRRQPLEVPSTYLWRRTIEDLHVNSLWQRLRQSILLLLQLLLIFLVMFALLRPGWQSEGVIGNRFVLLIDNSASMMADDVSPTRLDEAKARAAKIIAGMNASDVAMIIAFSDRAVPVQHFTSNKFELDRKLKSIEPTNHTSDLTEALRLAAGLANPLRFGDPNNPQDVATAKAQPAELYIFTDGRFAPVSNFDFGNLKPRYVILGDDGAKNVGITAFSVARNTERPDQLQAICRIENFGPEKVDKVNVSIYLNDEQEPRDTAEVELAEGRTGGYPFDLVDLESGTLRVVLEHDDDLPADNVAYAAINVPRRARVLLVTPQNDALETALGTEQAVKAAEVTIAEPKFLETEAYAKQADSATYDLIIFDQCAPKTKMPACNTLFIGRFPPSTKSIDEVAPADAAANKPEAPAKENAPEQPESPAKPKRQPGQWLVGPQQPAPAIIDTDRSHPLMQYIELGNVRIAEATPLDVPPGGTRLIDADIGTIFAIAPRRSFEDAVLSFEIVGANDKGERYANTDWTIRRSFPLFVMNVIEYLGGQGGSLSTGSVQPGKAITIRTDSPVDKLTITDPKREKSTLAREGQATFTFSKTDDLGVYDVFEGKELKQPAQRFAVNLFDPGESNIIPQAELRVGETEVVGQRQWQPMRRELWKWILLAGLGLLVAEWWIWNRRVYL